jgi:hypothetical protein
MGHPGMVYFKRRQNPAVKADYFPTLRKGTKDGAPACRLLQTVANCTVRPRGLSLRSRARLRPRALGDLDPCGI